MWDRLPAILPDDLDREYLAMDTTVVRAHQHAAGAKKDGGDQALGRSRGGLNSKLHLLVDALGQLVRVVLTQAQAHDTTQALALLDGQSAEHMIADTAYDA